MKLTLFSMGIGTIEVANAINEVARLLNLYNKIAASDAVDLSCRDEEAIARMGVVADKLFGESAFGHRLVEVFECEVFFKAAVNACALVGIDNVPHFGFSVGNIGKLLCHLVIGMHLDGERGGCTDEFDEEGEIFSVTSEVFLSHQCCTILFYEFSEAFTHIATFANDGFFASKP